MIGLGRIQKRRPTRTREFELELNGVKFIAPENRTILESAINNEVDISYSCGAGVCKQCAFHLEEGLVNNTNHDKSELLSCKTYPLSNLKIVQTKRGRRNVKSKR
ncbi:MAG: 2Fe-2S iron-sulfur cluster binding domain-containing protein [Sedimenticola sp.]